MAKLLSIECSYHNIKLENCQEISTYPKKNTVAVTFRCDVAVADQLDELCRMMGIKRSEFLISAITSEYDKMQGNPKLKDMLEQFKQITETMKQMTGQANAGTPVGIGDGAGGEGEA